MIVEQHLHDIIVQLHFLGIKSVHVFELVYQLFGMVLLSDRRAVRHDAVYFFIIFNVIE